MSYDLKTLQNGSDIRGISLAGVRGENPNLTPKEAEMLSKGFLVWLCRKTGKPPADLKIAVGRDPRLSGEQLKNGLFQGLAPYGVQALDCGLASTPAMFMSTVFPEYRCDGAVMITASHLPYNRNGFKYFDRSGGLNKSDIAQIISFAESGTDLPKAPEAESAASCDLMKTYCAHLRRMILDGVGRSKPLDGLKIVVDAGNGSGGFYAKDVLAPLGADVSQSQFLEPDGMFPNHAPNPEDPKAMASVAAKVLAAGADFGLIFDTDVDRSAAVDGQGREIARNGIVAMAAALIADDYPGTTIVTDSITSNQLSVFLEQKGLKHLRYQRGYKNVINKAIALNEQGTDSQLAIETSGHAAFKANYFLDDGAYLATKIVIKAAQLHARGKTLGALISGLESPLEAVEIRIPILCEDFGAYGDGVIADLKEFVKNQPDMAIVEPNYEGVRIAFKVGWCLLRKSLHEALLPLNIESDLEGGCNKIRETLSGFLSNYEQLDLTGLLGEMK